MSEKLAKNLNEFFGKIVLNLIFHQNQNMKLMKKIMMIWFSMLQINSKYK